MLNVKLLHQVGVDRNTPIPAVNLWSEFQNMFYWFIASSSDQGIVPYFLARSRPKATPISLTSGPIARDTFRWRSPESEGNRSSRPPTSICCWILPDICSFVIIGDEIDEGGSMDAWGVSKRLPPFPCQRCVIWQLIGDHHPTSPFLWNT